jgi:hypothetical protein
MGSIHKIYGLASPYFRKRRIELFRRTLCPRAESTILDIGGYPWIWEGSDIHANFTLLNPHAIPGLAQRFKGQFQMVVGDGCQLDYPNKSFDIVFSNSVIEHVGSFERQKAFAAEARRVGRSLWVQTPAREFIIEPHLMTPLVHFLPKSVQRRLLRYFTVWGLMTRPTAVQVEDFLNEIRLLNYYEMKELFPDCEIRREKVMGITKSYIAIRRETSPAYSSD